ncbi:MAG: hypothetical protein JNM98_17850 [Rhodocyclaceae bacterium]|nr:hypothetical protein [Rhodocyclaceae bacterium]
MNQQMLTPGSSGTVPPTTEKVGDEEPSSPGKPNIVPIKITVVFTPQALTKFESHCRSIEERQHICEYVADHADDAIPLEEGAGIPLKQLTAFRIHFRFYDLRLGGYLLVDSIHTDSADPPPPSPNKRRFLDVVISGGVSGLVRWVIDNAIDHLSLIRQNNFSLHGTVYTRSNTVNYSKIFIPSVNVQHDSIRLLAEVLVFVNASVEDQYIEFRPVLGSSGMGKEGRQELRVGWFDVLARPHGLEINVVPERPIMHDNGATLEAIHVGAVKDTLDRLSETHNITIPHFRYVTSLKWELCFMDGEVLSDNSFFLDQLVSTAVSGKGSILLRRDQSIMVGVGGENCFDDEEYTSVSSCDARAPSWNRPQLVAMPPKWFMHSGKLGAHMMVPRTSTRRPLRASARWKKFGNEIEQVSSGVRTNPVAGLSQRSIFERRRRIDLRRHLVENYSNSCLLAGSEATDSNGDQPPQMHLVIAGKGNRGLASEVSECSTDHSMQKFSRLGDIEMNRRGRVAMSPKKVGKPLTSDEQLMKIVDTAEKPTGVENCEAGTSYEVQISRVVDVRSIRKSLNMTQDEFAKVYALSLASLRNWEQGTRVPERPIALYLKLIEKYPTEVRREIELMRLASGNDDESV